MSDGEFFLNMRLSCVDEVVERMQITKVSGQNTGLLCDCNLRDSIYSL